MSHLLVGIVCFVVGALLGVMLTCVLVVGSDADDHSERMLNDLSSNQVGSGET